MQTAHTAGSRGVVYVFGIHFKQPKKKKSKSKCFVSPPLPPLINYSAFSLSFVQVALSRVMPLKCQLSVWTCIALHIKYSSPHTNSQCFTEGNKIWSLHFPIPRRPCALIICQSDRCFSNDGVSCVLNFYQSPTVRDCGTQYTIWWQNPPWTESLGWEAFCRKVSTAEEAFAGVVCRGEPGPSLPFRPGPAWQICNSSKVWIHS